MEILLIIFGLVLLALLFNIGKATDKLGSTFLAPAIAFISGATLQIYAFVSIIAIIFSFTNINTYVILIAIGVGVFSAFFMYKIDAKAKLTSFNPNQSSKLKVSTVNLFSKNQNSKELAIEVRADKPDIIFVQELDSSLRRNIFEVLNEDYPFFAESTIVDQNDAAIFSKYELRNVERVGDIIIKADIIVDYEPVVLICVHLTSPTSKIRFESWLSCYNELENLIKFSEVQKFIIAGDFNSTSGHRIYRDFVTKNNLKDVSYGLLTWTPKKGVVPSFMSLDHILISEDINAHEAYTSNGAGSDHQPIHAVISV